MTSTSSSSSSGVETDPTCVSTQRRRRQRIYYEITGLLKQYDAPEEQFINMFGLDPGGFNRLTCMVAFEMSRVRIDYFHLHPIHVRDRVGLCLRYLVTGLSFAELAYFYGLTTDMVETVISKVCDAIVKHLVPFVMPIPSKKLWKKIARDYKKIYKMPNCLGSLNGRFISVKKNPTYMLLTLVDANERFVMIDIGDFGTSPQKIWGKSNMAKLFSRNKLEIPPEKSPRRGYEPLPYVMVGGNSFLLKPYLLSKYIKTEFEDDAAHKVFCSRIDPIKRTAESAVTRMRRRWQVIHHDLEVEIPDAKRILMATCCLENCFFPQNI